MGSRTVPIRCLCRFAGVPIPSVYAILRGELTPSKNQTARLEQAIRAVQDGMRWRRVGERYEITNPEKFMMLPRFERPKHRVPA